MEIDFDRLLNWLNHYGLPQYHVHVSGHMMPLRLKSAIKAINPKQVFPVHTENPELFCRFTRDLASKTTMVQKGIQYQI
jgi:mRNA degradation ribonuclease J1/J2